jgi:hypothetical protein
MECQSAPLRLTVSCALVTGSRTGPDVGLTGSLGLMLVGMPLRFRQGDKGTGTVRFCRCTG